MRPLIGCCWEYSKDILKYSENILEMLQKKPLIQFCLKMLQNEAANQLLLAIFRWSADDAAPSLVSRLAGVYNQAAKVFQTFPAIYQISPPTTPLK